MYTENYPKEERKTFEKYSKSEYLLYLNEQPVTYSLTARTAEADGDVEIVDEPVEGYSYTGNQPDGGMLIQATEATYDAFASGLIRLVYSADAVEAILSNKTLALDNPEHPRAAEFNDAWAKFQAYREGCKEKAEEVLNR